MIFQKNKKISDKKFLKTNPLCAVCMRQGKYTQATQVFVMTNGYKESRCDNCSKPKVLN